VPATACGGLAALQEGRELDLVRGGDDLRPAQQLLEVRHEEVADPDRARPLLGVEPLKRAPRVESLAAFQSFVVTKICSRGIPLARTAAPTSASLP
jgi:hypothetical protein